MATVGGIRLYDEGRGRVESFSFSPPRETRVARPGKLYFKFFIRRDGVSTENKISLRSIPRASGVRTTARTTPKSHRYRGQGVISKRVKTRNFNA